jgi:hypothetical protein
VPSLLIIPPLIAPYAVPAEPKEIGLYPSIEVLASETTPGWLMPEILLEPKIWLGTAV